MTDPMLITSPLSGPFTEGDMTVDVQIYRLEDTRWTLEVAPPNRPISDSPEVRFQA